jgi:hypothetical protein
MQADGLPIMAITVLGDQIPKELSQLDRCIHAGIFTYLSSILARSISSAGPLSPQMWFTS